MWWMWRGDTREVDMFTMDDIIDIAVKIEKNGEKVYHDALQKVSDPSLISLLQWLADEEVQHADWFFGLKKKTLQISVSSEFEEMGKKILGDAMKISEATPEQLRKIEKCSILAAGGNPHPRMSPKKRGYKQPVKSDTTKNISLLIELAVVFNLKSILTRSSV